MPSPVGAHPSADTLQAFGLGKLDDRAAQGVIEHLAACPACARLVAAQSGDDFLVRVRDAQRPGTTPVPVQLAGRRTPEPTTLPPRPAVLLSVPPELAANEQYEVLRELGRGGMGVVYLARNRLLERLEVLKVVNQDLLARAGSKERFLREIQSAAKLNHPNVVTAYNALQLGDLMVFAMEYVEGEDLAQVVKARGPLPVVNACYYVQQAALGLQHACDRQMVHRDIKPQNLILARVGKRHVVKILDFGLAKVVREKAEESALTGAGKMLGTPDYIAPEQSVDAASADIRADIYSLGCTFYYLLTGGPPFKGNSLYAILQAHHTETAKAANLVRPEVPAELAAVLEKMMAKGPAARYQKPAEVAQALVPFIKTMGKPLPSEPTLKPIPASGKTEKKQEIGPETIIPAAFKQETMTERPRVIPPARRRTVKRDPASAKKGKKVFVRLGVIIGVLCLAGLVGLWAGVFRVQTRDGVLVVQVNEPNPDVYWGDDKLTVTWGAGGKMAEIRVKPGTRQISIKKDGFTAYGKTVTLEEGGHQVIAARLEVTPVAPGGQGKTVEGKERIDRAGTSPVPAVEPTKSPRKPLRDYDELAKGRWLGALNSEAEFNRLQSEMAFWGPKPTYANGILSCNGGRLFFPPLRARDAIVRAWVEKVRTKNNKGNVALSLRYGDDGFVSAWFNGGGWFGIGNSRRGRGGWKDLKWCKLSDKYDDYFEFAFAAVGDKLIAYANGKQILEAQNDVPAGDPAGIGVGGLGLFHSIEVQVLDPPSPPAAGAEVKENAFVPLFNGKDLTGWKTHPSQPGHWRVENGILIGSGPGTSHLFSERGDYKNFHISAEARINAGGNSGLHFRALFDKFVNGRWPYGYEAQINVTHGDPNKTGSLFANGHGAALVSLRQSPVPAGAWFTLDIIAQDNHLIVQVNGRTTADVQDGARWFSSGHIALQQHNPQTICEFRKIEIKELPTTDSRVNAMGQGKDMSAGFVPLFNGKDLTGWEKVASGATTWTVKNDMLVGENHGKAGRPAFLVTQRRDYRDFHFRAEVSLSKGLNTVLGFRVDSSDKKRGGLRGYGVFIAGPNDKAKGATGRLMTKAHLQPSELLKDLKETLDVRLPPGKWFRLEIIAHGSHLQVLIDGKMVAACDDSQKLFSQGALDITCRPGNVISLRQVEIKELTVPTSLP
jgi:serine/threonine protein kinase